MRSAGQFTNVCLGLSLSLICLLGISAAAEQPAPEPPTVSVPSSSEAMPFEIENNTITYEYSDDLGMPCYYHMQGMVHDIHGEPFTEFVVNIKMLDFASPPVGYAWPGENAPREFGPSGWGSLLPQAPVPYLVWLTDGRGGRRISSIVWLPSLGCDGNTAVINFVQVRSFTSEGPEPTDTFEVTAEIVSPADEELPFTMLNNTISYSYKETLDKPCNRIIERYIYTALGESHTEFVVNIDMVEIEPMQGADFMSHAFPDAVSTISRGPLAWSALLVSWDVSYTIWLSETVGGERISPMVLVPTQDCDHNLATINFVQDRPVSEDDI